MKDIRKRIEKIEREIAPQIAETGGVELLTRLFDAPEGSPEHEQEVEGLSAEVWDKAYRQHRAKLEANT